MSGDLSVGPIDAVDDCVAVTRLLQSSAHYNLVTLQQRAEAKFETK